MSTFWHALFTGCALAPAAALFGKIAGHCRLPQITGYLLFGVLVGPYVFRLITDETIQKLRIIDEVCLSAIATAAGAELHLAELQKAKMQVTYLTLAVSVFSWGFCYLALFAMLPFLNVTDASTPAPVIIGITSLGATLMVARSPASAMAVLHETGGKGPFCNLVMAVVVVKDVLVVVGFALNLEAIRVLAVEPDSTAAPLLSQILEPFMSITMSITIGIAVGLQVQRAVAVVGGALQGSVLLGVVLRLPVHAPGSRNISSSTATFARAPLLLATATALFHLAASLQAEPLLACVTSGLICANRRYDRGQRDRDELQAILSLLMPGVNVAFFGLTGASLRLWALADALWVAGVVCVVRLAALYCGSWLGCWMSTVPQEQRQVFWMSMVTQAGVALGLARMVGARFPGWGTHFQTVAVSIIIINLIAGPPLFKLAIQQTGEAHRIPRAAAAADIDSRHATSPPTLETAASLTASIA